MNYDKVIADAKHLRQSIPAEQERLLKRPVPTTPWVMSLSLDDLDAIAERAIKNSESDAIPG